MDALLSTARFVVTDLETTGLSPQRNRVTEVACVYVEGGQIVGEKRTLVNPEQFIPLEVQRLTGITNASVLAAPKAPEVFPRVREWVHDGQAVVAHNATFDVNFLRAELARQNLPTLELRSLCTARLARRLLPAQRSWSLGRLAAYFGIRVRNRHTALGDARITAEALLRMLDMLQDDHDCQTVSDAIAFQFRTVSRLVTRPPHVQALQPVLAELPAAPGVYRMLDRRGMVLYVGKAKSLRDRVGSYFRPGATHPTRIREMVRRVRDIQVELTGSELGALLLESRLIHELQPKYNTLQKRLRRYHFARIDLRDPFPAVAITRETAGDGAEYFGPFSGRDSVELVIDTVQRLFKLRECEGSVRPDAAALPCLYHQIERCGAPCAGMQTSEQYAVEVERVRAFLSGSEEGIVEALRRRMFECAERLQFEEAALLRDRVDDLTRVFTGRRRIAESINGNNVIIVLPAPQNGGREIFMVRFGRLARQIIVPKRVHTTQLRRHIEEVYMTGAFEPPRFEREEVAEIRIIASYIHRYRDKGRFVYVTPDDTARAVLQRLLEMMRGRRRTASVEGAAVNAQQLVVPFV